VSRRRLTTRSAAAVAAVLSLPGCGGAAQSGDRIAGNTLTIYASAPLQGASGVNGRAMINGAMLALAQAHGKVGRYEIRFKPLDDATTQARGWDPGQTTLNARAALQDPTTIGYIGDFNSGASAISIPLLNRFDIAQVSPSSTAVGLTSDAPGAAPGEPQKYYPTGARTYVRVVPNDSVQAAAQVQLQERVGCKKTFVLDDGRVDGEDTATSFGLAARSAGLEVQAIESFPRGAADYSGLVASVAQSGADCVLITGGTESGAALLTEQLAAAMPKATIFGAAGVAESTYTDPAAGGIPLALDPRVLITVAALPPSDYPRSGQAFFKAYVRRFGPAEPNAIFGYEAMSLLLHAISRATGGGHRSVRRSNVVKAIFATRNRVSVLGTYSIDTNGDTTLRRYGVYRIVNGQLEFWKALEG
jgi:branched-chain amino acid transport system substrate-binding protein